MRARVLCAGFLGIRVLRGGRRGGGGLSGDVAYLNPIATHRASNYRAITALSQHPYLQLVDAGSRKHPVGVGGGQLLRGNF